MSKPQEEISLLFRAVIALAALFCITIFAMVAAMVGDNGSPVVRFLNDHGGTIIVVEVIATLAVCFLAMAADRIKTLRSEREQENKPQHSTEP